MFNLYLHPKRLLQQRNLFLRLSLIMGQEVHITYTGILQLQQVTRERNQSKEETVRRLQVTDCQLTGGMERELRRLLQELNDFTDPGNGTTQATKRHVEHHTDRRCYDRLSNHVAC